MQYLFMLLIVGLSIYLSLKRKGPDPLDQVNIWPYIKNPRPLSPEQINFYQALRRYIDRQLIICPQVALEKIVYVPDNARLKKSMKEKNRGHWVDFAICSPDLELICIAQLNIANDPSADFLPALQKIAKNAAVPLLVFESAYEYTPQMFSAINDLYHAGSYH